MAVASAIASYGLFKKPPWPRQKMILYGFGSAFMSHDLGEVGVYGLRQRWMQRLENQRGFEMAMVNIESRLKNEQMEILTKRPGPAQTIPQTAPPSIPSIPAKDHDLSGHSAQWSSPQGDWRSDTETVPQSTPNRDNSGSFLNTRLREMLTVTTFNSEFNLGGENSGQSLSRWDEIRRQQWQATSRTSAWDRVREGQTRGSGFEQDNRIREPRQSDPDRERAKAQAEFDKLLEKERRMGSD
jgi:hypothetical protein